MGIFDDQIRMMPEFISSQSIMPERAVIGLQKKMLIPLNISNLMLKKGESCFFADKSYYVKVTERTRRVRKTKGRSVPSLLFKGVRYQNSRSETEPVTEKTTEYVKGYLYITNKRILFLARDQALEKNVNTMASYVPYSNGIGLQFGEKMFTFLLPRAEVAVCVLRLLK